MKNHQKKLSLGVLGPQYTNSDFAADHYQKLEHISCIKIYFPTISAIFEAVEKSEVQKGIVPLENNLAGPIAETSQQILKRAVSIKLKFSFSIHYAMVVLPGAIAKNIETIASHEQALKQCHNYLEKNFPKAIKKNCLSTIAALQKIFEEKDKHCAGIIPSEAAKIFKVKILKEGIESDKKNQTIFIVIEKG